jgi:hypothetical protein
MLFLETAGAPASSPKAARPHFCEEDEHCTGRAFSTKTAAIALLQNILFHFPSFSTVLDLLRELFSALVVSSY